MPALTFRVTANAIDADFGAVQLDGVRQALDFDVASPEHDNRQFSVPGVDGVWVMRAGQRAGRISLTVRYYGTIAAAALAYKTDRELFAKIQLYYI